MRLIQPKPQSQHLPSFAMDKVKNKKYSRGVEGREEPCFMSAP